MSGVAKAGRDPLGQALVSDEAATHLHPPGFDPSRVMREALEKIRDLKERPFEGYPEDWREQIAACPECQGWAKNHPIQRGICDEHRRPIWAQERHDNHETAILGIRAQYIARDALDAIATEARRAETTEIGSVHEGAGPQDIAQPEQPR